MYIYNLTYNNVVLYATYIVYNLLKHTY